MEPVLTQMTPAPNVSLADVEAYQRVALSMGRPTTDCGCLRCECELHVRVTVPTSFPPPCIWCANGQHRGGPR